MGADRVSRGNEGVGGGYIDIEIEKEKEGKRWKCT